MLDLCHEHLIYRRREPQKDSQARLFDIAAVPLPPLGKDSINRTFGQQREARLLASESTKEGFGLTLL